MILLFCQFQEIPEHFVTVLRGDAFRVKLNTVKRKFLVGNPHDNAAIRFRRDIEAIG